MHILMNKYLDKLCRNSRENFPIDFFDNSGRECASSGATGRPLESNDTFTGMHELSEFNFSMEEVYEAIKTFKPSKSPGPSSTNSDTLINYNQYLPFPCRFGVDISAKLRFLLL